VKIELRVTPVSRYHNVELVVNGVTFAELMDREEVIKLRDQMDADFREAIQRLNNLIGY